MGVCDNFTTDENCVGEAITNVKFVVCGQSQPVVGNTRGERPRSGVRGHCRGEERPTQQEVSSWLAGPEQKPGMPRPQSRKRERLPG